MADELKEEEGAEQTRESEASEAEETPVGDAAEAQPAEEPEVEVPEVASGAFNKSPEEIAAEEAMLAELEKSMISDDSSDGDVSVPDDDSPDLANAPVNLDLLMDVNLLITVELGRKEMRFGEILQLGKGSLVELSKIADEPVDIYVNQSKIAEGEVVVVDDHFGVRITRLLNANRTLRSG